MPVTSSSSGTGRDGVMSIRQLLVLAVGVNGTRADTEGVVISVRGGGDDNGPCCVYNDNTISSWCVWYESVTYIRIYSKQPVIRRHVMFLKKEREQ